MDINMLSEKPTDSPSSQQALELPRTETEKSLATIWCEVLNIAEAGRQDNFVTLGGHSLQATQVISRVRIQLQVDLSFRTFFDHPTLADQAGKIDRLLADKSPMTQASDANISILPRTTPLPLSFSQRRMWLVQQMNPETTAYNMPFAMRMFGSLNIDAFTQALDAVVRRHEAFRTRFELVDGVPMQAIDPPTTTALQVEVIRLSHIPTPERQGAAERLMTERTQQPFDLSKSSLHRACLISMGEDDQIFLWVIHHAVGDLWSTGILLRELALEYETRLKGKESALNRSQAIEFADYASWQCDALHQRELARQLSYWRTQLQGLQKISLPGDLQRRTVANGRGGTVITTLPHSFWSSLKQLSACQEATPFMILLACFKVLLSRYCAQDDIAVGTPIANRHRIESEHVVGTLINTLVMRTDMSGNPSFVELLARVRNCTLEAYANQDIPFDRLVEELPVTRDLSSSPLVQVMFNMDNALLGKPRLGDMRIEPFDFDPGAAQFDLSITADAEVFGQLRLEYADDLFNRNTARRMLDNYVGLLEQILDDPSTPIRDYAILSDAGLAELAAWNDTYVEYPKDLLIHSLVSTTALRSLDNCAVQYGSNTLTYAELEARTNQLSQALRARGIGRGTLVGLCVERSISMVVAQLAILKSGAAYVPLDPAYPADRLAYMAEDAQLALLVTESALVHALNWPRESSLLLDTDALEISSKPTMALPFDELYDARPEDPAYVIYTSGSTGKPKGVVVQHRAVVNFLTSMAHEPGLTNHDILVAVTTLSFDIAVLELLLPLSIGARVVLASRDQALDGVALRQLLESTGATIMQATPSTWRILIDSGWQGSTTFKALIGGEGLPNDLAIQLMARTGELWNMYGPTETTVWSTCWKVLSPKNGISIGKPIANTTIHILDGRQQPCPIGVPGEIYIGGDGVTLGYLHRPELTAERFIPDPFSLGARLYRTGDQGRWRHDGLLEHMGRLDFQVKVRGYRIELGEIESNLASHPQVARTTVIVREDTPGDVRLVAYVVARNGMPDGQALREHLRTNLPDYMVPQHFIELTVIPLLPNGKINRHQLPAPTEALSHSSSDFVAPRNSAEVAVAEIWGRLLGVPQISVSDNFFDLGGHSLLAMRAITEMNRRFGTKINVRQIIFESMGQIANCISETKTSDIPTSQNSDASDIAVIEDAPISPLGALGRFLATLFSNRK
jgi:amino acid adenylation domain-containing protein